jgi:hypothetical protein
VHARDEGDDEVVTTATAAAPSSVAVKPSCWAIGPNASMPIGMKTNETRTS